MCAEIYITVLDVANSFICGLWPLLQILVHVLVPIIRAVCTRHPPADSYHSRNSKMRFWCIANYNAYQKF